MKSCDALTQCSDYDSIEAAIIKAKQNTDAPTVINMKTTIGYGSLGAGGHDVHGARKSTAMQGVMCNC